MTENPFRIDVLARAHSARLVLHGAFDLTAAPHFRDVVGRLRGTGIRQLVVDLRRLDFLDARALQELVTLDTAARQDGHNLALVAAGSHVDEPFRMTGLDERFVFVESPDDLTPP